MPGSQGRRPLALIRVPLYIKVMVSYLLVVGLILLPTLFYLRTLLQEDLREGARNVMATELESLARRMDGQASPGTWDLFPYRVTVVDLRGSVLSDSLGQDFSHDNHGRRPEILAALRDGQGWAIRTSTTTHELRLYGAQRFPIEGVAKGVVRLSIALHHVDGVVARGLSFTGKAGALGLSAAVLLSLVAAFVVSRPLRRLTDAARAFASGDFGHQVDVDSNDEIGDAAQALRDMAERLRGTLVAAGADRASLRALVQELPLGVILYDSLGHPVLVNGQARELAELLGPDELERARRLIRFPEQAESVAVAQSERRAQERALVLPWSSKKKSRLSARWVCLYAEDGTPESALILTDASADHRAKKISATLSEAAHEARSLGKIADEPRLRAALEELALSAEREVLRAPMDEAGMEIVSLRMLLETAVDALKSRALLRGVEVELDLPETDVELVESDGRAELAVRLMVAGLVRDCPANEVLRIHADVRARSVRLHGWRPGSRKLKLRGAPELVHALGGDAGIRSEPDGSEVWLTLPRA